MTTTEQLVNEIEAILFYKTEPMTVVELARLLVVEQSEVKTALEHLAVSLENGGVVLVSNKNEYSLATSPNVASLIEKMIKDELNRDLSVASLEVLSIIAYKGPVSRKEIEYIRGVNSTYSLRALLMRGLIEKESSRLDERVFLYKPTTDLLLHLGVKSIEELPEWQEMHREVEKVSGGEVKEEEE